MMQKDTRVKAIQLLTIILLMDILLCMTINIQFLMKKVTAKFLFQKTKKRKRIQKNNLRMTILCIILGLTLIICILQFKLCRLLLRKIHKEEILPFLLLLLLEKILQIPTQVAQI